MSISDLNDSVTIGSSTDFVFYSSRQTSLQSVIYLIFEKSGIAVRTRRQQVKAVYRRVSKGVRDSFPLTGGERE